MDALLRYDLGVFRSAFISAASCFPQRAPRQTVDLADHGLRRRVSRWVHTCDPLSATCAVAITVGCDNSDGASCPNSTRTGDRCAVIGAFLPCPGASNDDCANGGCRTCLTDATWSECACADGTTGCLCKPTNGDVEICDGIDNDCNGIVDDAARGAQGCKSFYPDRDGDGYGDDTAAPDCECTAPAGEVDNNKDVNDNDASINPTTGEVCDGADNDGDGVIPANEIDHDGDHYVPCSPWVGTIGTILGGGDCNDGERGGSPHRTRDLRRLSLRL